METITTIQKLVAKEFRVPVSALRKKGNRDEVVIARHCSYFLCHQAGHTNRRELSRAHGLKYWGGEFNYIMKNIENRKETDLNFKIILNRLVGRFRANPSKETIIHQLKGVQQRIDRGDLQGLSVEKIIQSIENEL